MVKLNILGVKILLLGILKCVNSKQILNNNSYSDYDTFKNDTNVLNLTSLINNKTIDYGNNVDEDIDVDWYIILFLSLLYGAISIISVFPIQYIDYIGISGPAYRLYRYFRNDISSIPIFPERHIDYTDISGTTYRLYRYFKIGISIISVFLDRHIDYTDTNDKTDTDTDTDIIDKRYPALLGSGV